MVYMKHVTRAVFVVALVAATCGALYASGEEISLALNYGAFYPTSSATQDSYDNRWTRFSITTFEPTKPTKQRFIVEVGSYDLNGNTSEIRMIPLTAGYEKGIGDHPNAQPYVALRAGPYFGRAKNTLAGTSDSTVGLNANASMGVVFRKRFYAEVRYDAFSPFAGSNFSGVSLAAGMKILNLRL
jgi:hypothetical protein